MMNSKLNRYLFPRPKMNLKLTKVERDPLHNISLQRAFSPQVLRPTLDSTREEDLSSSRKSKKKINYGKIFDLTLYDRKTIMNRPKNIIKTEFAQMPN